MATGAIGAFPLAGASTVRTTAEAEFALGTPLLTVGDKSFIYVQAGSSAIPATTVVVVSPTFGATAGAGDYTADTALPANAYGWVRSTPATPPG